MRHTPAPSRSVGIDVVRVIAIVAIVAGHAWTRDRSALVLSLAGSVLISAGLILCAEAVAPKLPQAAAVWVSRCAMAGLSVVLVHPLFLWASRPWPAFVLGLLIPGAIGLIALRTPISPWVTGQDRLDGPDRSSPPATSAWTRGDAGGAA